MYIARKLRQRNIVAYVLYMMQVEDTLRAYDLDIERLQREYLSRFDYDDEQVPENRSRAGSEQRHRRFGAAPHRVA